MRYYIEGNEITNDIISDVDPVQTSGALFADQGSIVPERLIIQVDNQDGKYDADYSMGTYGPGNDLHGQVLTIQDESEIDIWAGYISRVEMMDDQKTVEIEAFTFIGKIIDAQVTWTNTTDTPSAIIQELLETKVQINTTWIDSASFIAEDSFDTANGLSCYINIPAGSEVSAVELLEKLCLIFNKRLYVFRNAIFISHLYEYQGSLYQHIESTDIIYEGLKRWRDYKKACNACLIAYNNAGALAWVERDLTDVGKTTAEYQQNIKKYGIKYFFAENTFLTDRDGTTVIMAHATSASAQYIADQVLTIYGEAPLMAEFETDLSTEALLFRWNSLPFFASVDVSFNTHTGISYTREPVEIEYKKGLYQQKKGILKVRFLDKYPSNFGVESATWDDDTEDFEALGWE